MKSNLSLQTSSQDIALQHDGASQSPQSTSVPPPPQDVASNSPHPSHPSFEHGDHGRWRLFGSDAGDNTIPLYTDTIKVKWGADGVASFSGADGVVKSLLEFTHREEQKAKTEEIGLHHLVGKTGLAISLTADQEIKTIWQVLKKVLAPSEVSMIDPANGTMVVKKQIQPADGMKHDVLTAMLYDQMELGGQAFGPRMLSIAGGDEEAGPRELSIPEYLQTFTLAIRCKNSELSRRVLTQLQRHPKLVADMQAELIRSMENRKSINRKTVLGFAMSAGVSVGVGVLYEYLLSQKVLKPLLPGAKRAILPAEDPLSAGRRVIEAAPHLLPRTSKLGAVAIDDIPPGAIEVLDTLGALTMKDGGQASASGLPQVALDRTGQAIMVQTFAGVENDDDDESVFEKLNSALQGGGISMATALPTILLSYFKAETHTLKVLAGLGSISAELTQMAGATAGVSRELRQDLTHAKAQILELIREGIIAPPPDGANQKSYVDGKAHRQISRASRTSPSEAAIGAGMLVAMMAAVFGPHVLNMVSDEQARPFKSAVYQPWEAIGMMLITLGAMYVGTTSRQAGALGAKIFTNDKQKSSQRLATMLDKQGSAQRLTVMDNLLIDKPFMAQLGRAAISTMAWTCVMAIKSAQLLHIASDSRDEARLPYASRNPDFGDEISALQATPDELGTETNQTASLQA